MPRKIVLVASLVAGIAAALLTKIYLGGKERILQERRADFDRRFGTMEVVCLRHEVAAGTELSKKDLGIIEVPEAGMRDRAVMESEVDDFIVGHKIAFSRSRGDVLLWSDMECENPHDTGLSGDIKREMRAISINCSGSSAVSGVIKPNDHVDVIGTFVFQQSDGATKQGDIETCTILQNVLVLATGQTTAKNELLNRGSSTVTLEVTPQEAEMIAFAEQMKGRLVLTLRNRTDNSSPSLPPVDYEKIKAMIGDLNMARHNRMERRR